MKQFFLKHFWSVLAFLYAALLFHLSSIPDPYFVGPSNDKVMHVLAYAGLGALLCLAFKFRIPSWKLIFLVGLLGSLYGVSDEWHQYYVPGRFFSYGDMLADAIGSFLGGGLWCLVRSWMAVMQKG